MTQNNFISNEGAFQATKKVIVLVVFLHCIPFACREIERGTTPLGLGIHRDSQGMK